MKSKFLLLCGIVLIAGCGGSSSSSTSAFSGNWSGTGTLTNPSGTVVVNGTVTEFVDPFGDVSGNDTVSIGNVSETESAVIAGGAVPLTLTQGTAPTQVTYTATVTPSINASGQLAWTGTEVISGTTYGVNYLLNKQ